MQSSIKIAPKSARDIAYYRQRFRNRVFHKVIEFVSRQVEQEGFAQKDLAEAIGKDPSQLSRLLREPSNLTLDTISDVLLAFDAEAEPMEIVLFKDLRPSNYMNPLVARALNLARPELKAESTGSKKVSISPTHSREKMKITFESAPT